MNTAAVVVEASKPGAVPRESVDIDIAVDLLVLQAIDAGSRCEHRTWFRPPRACQLTVVVVVVGGSYPAVPSSFFRYSLLLPFSLESVVHLDVCNG